MELSSAVLAHVQQLPDQKKQMFFIMTLILLSLLPVYGFPTEDVILEKGGFHNGSPTEDVMLKKGGLHRGSNIEIGKKAHFILENANLRIPREDAIIVFDNGLVLRPEDISVPNGKDVVVVIEIPDDGQFIGPCKLQYYRDETDVYEFNVNISGKEAVINKVEMGVLYVGEMAREVVLKGENLLSVDEIAIEPIHSFYQNRFDRKDITYINNSEIKVMVRAVAMPASNVTITYKYRTTAGFNSVLNEKISQYRVSNGDFLIRNGSIPKAKFNPEIMLLSEIRQLEKGVEISVANKIPVKEWNKLVIACSSTDKLFDDQPIRFSDSPDDSKTYKFNPQINQGILPGEKQINLTDGSSIKYSGVITVLPDPSIQTIRSNHNSLNLNPYNKDQIIIITGTSLDYAIPVIENPSLADFLTLTRIEGYSQRQSYRVNFDANKVSSKEHNQLFGTSSVIRLVRVKDSNEPPYSISDQAIVIIEPSEPSDLNKIVRFSINGEIKEVKSDTVLPLEKDDKITLFINDIPVEDGVQELYLTATLYDDKGNAVKEIKCRRLNSDLIKLTPKHINYQQYNADFSWSISEEIGAVEAFQKIKITIAHSGTHYKNSGRASINVIERSFKIKPDIKDKFILAASLPPAMIVWGRKGQREVVTFNLGVVGKLRPWIGHEDLSDPLSFGMQLVGLDITGVAPSKNDSSQTNKLIVKGDIALSFFTEYALYSSPGLDLPFQIGFGYVAANKAVERPDFWFGFIGIGLALK